MILYRYLALLFVLVQFPPVTTGQSVRLLYKSDLFENDSVLELTIKMNCDSLYNGGFSESIEYKGVMSYKNEPDNELKIPVKITKRGHFRKMYNVCNFPPLRIEFSKKTTKNSLFEGMDKIKLITHCINGDSSFDQYVIEEYLIYKTYNIITDYSFKVRLARIKYVDTSGKNPVMTRYAFFIENTGSLADRMKGSKLDFHFVYPEVIEQYHYCIAGIFQYMIYNTDWSINLLHNVELIGIYPSLRPVAVPFDFDMAGLINIPYKSPILAYKQGKEPERQFTIKKVNRKLIVAAVKRFKFKKNEILLLYQNNPYLSESNKVKTLGSLSSFFRILDDRKLVRSEFFK